MAGDVNKNSIVLKVNGDLTLESGYTLTSVKSGTAVGKGLFIYCTGTVTINGTVSMSGVTCTAPSQDVFLWKNSDATFEYIRKIGGDGGTKNGGNAKGFGYDFVWNTPSGGQESAKDSHLICGGGGGGAQKVAVTQSRWITNQDRKSVV